MGSLQAAVLVNQQLFIAAQSNKTYRIFVQLSPLQLEQLDG